MSSGSGTAVTSLVAVVGTLTASCAFLPVASAVISRPNFTRVDMVFSNAALGNPSSLTWFGGDHRLAVPRTR